MAKSNEIDMLHGPLFLKILMFSLPLAASSVLQQIFNSVDVAVVGHFASKQHALKGQKLLAQDYGTSSTP